MKIKTITLLAGQVWRNARKKSGTLWLIFIFNSILSLSLMAGFWEHDQTQENIHHSTEKVREQWESNPDKHPHRMAHYGYVVFREKFPLAFFDFGMDSYLGNLVFLEAHKQNTANFSEASLSNGLLRFGEISAGMILQVLLPLLLFFWGYALISQDREEGTLKILLAQGVSGFELIIGRTLGLTLLSLSVFSSAFLLGLGLLVFSESESLKHQAFAHFIGLGLAYMIYYFIISLIAVLVSSKSSSSKSSLITLIGIWLLFTLILPKISQVIGQQLFPSLTKIEFDWKVDQELIKQGDSHNPNDPHYKAFKDSLLQAYNVTTTQELPVNFSGLVMREGEKLSSQTFLTHQNKLIETFQNQQDLVRITAWINPYMAIKNLSMALSGTDYLAFNRFQNQAESYRYLLAQTMNELQIEYISNNVKNSSDPKAKLSQKNWENFPAFEQDFLSLWSVLKNEILSILALVSWIVILLAISVFYSKNLKVF
jgi:ABC-2 type transport system permease protein